MMYGNEGQRAAIGSDRANTLRDILCHTTAAQTDYDETERAALHLFGRIGSATDETLEGVNFMTPDVLGVRRIGGRLVELSIGSAFLAPGWVFGVSVRPDPLGLSTCCHDLDELELVLENVKGVYS